MKRTKTQKGITLVALIITIIVLLILAVVAINAVQDDGIIEYAKNARNEYEKAQTNESTLLGNYMNYIKENVPTSKIITFTIGSITYHAEEGMTWLEWVNSEYNNVLESDSTVKSFACNEDSSLVSGLNIYNISIYLCSSEEENMEGKDVILEGGTYYWWQSSTPDD